MIFNNDVLFSKYVKIRFSGEVNDLISYRKKLQVCRQLEIRNSHKKFKTIEIEEIIICIRNSSKKSPKFITL